MTKLVKREGILAKIESTPGTDAAPTASADSIMIENVGWSFAGARMVERNPVQTTIGKLAPAFGGTLMEITFDVELKGSGTAGTAPELGVLLRACGFGETVVAVTSVTYAGVSTGFEYITIWFYEDGSLYKMTGCQGNWELNATTGEVIKLSFTFTGHVTGPTDVSLPTFVFDSTVPPAFLSAGFVTDSYSSVIESLQFSPGNEVVTPVDANSANGYDLVRISDRDYAGSFNPQATLVSADDPIGDWQGGTEKNITTGVIGSAGNRFQLAMPTSNYKEIAPGDRDGIRTYDIGFMAAGADAACSLAFT